VVLGNRELETKTITVESYFDGKLTEVTTVEALAARMRDEIDRKVAQRR
jgi:hypothetical protein